MTNLSLVPAEAVRTLLDTLPSRRMRAVVEKRYGLKSGSRRTLEAIGTEYKITRERVRQVENEALKIIAKSAAIEKLAPVFQEMASHIQARGGVIAEAQLLADLGERRAHPYLALLLKVGKLFFKLEEDTLFHGRWALDADRAKRVERTMNSVVKALAEQKQPINKEGLHQLVAEQAQEIIGPNASPEISDAYIGITKSIGRNPYGEYGLMGWPEITPSGVKDKAYVALVKSGRPLHFREVAKAIDEAQWSLRRAHPQTVHNELIKDARFVLVGRGLYALRAWGYEPGVVRDVVHAVLRDAKRPLSREEIIKSVLERRVVKVPTILLNLQNKNLFHRTDDEKYTLV